MGTSFLLLLLSMPIFFYWSWRVRTIYTNCHWFLYGMIDIECYEYLVRNAILYRHDGKAFSEIKLFWFLTFFLKDNDTCKYIKMKGQEFYIFINNKILIFIRRNGKIDFDLIQTRNIVTEIHEFLLHVKWRM